MKGLDKSTEVLEMTVEKAQPPGCNTEMADATRKEQKADDNVESSSTGSDAGKGGGSGSGGGYSADCSSSDASSLEAAKGNVPEKEMTRLSLGSDAKKVKATKAKEAKPSKASKTVASKSQKASRRSNDFAESSNSGSIHKKESIIEMDTNWKNHDGATEETCSLPQWNGVRIQHPMDPRIDLSTVGYIQTSSLSAYPRNVDIPTRQPTGQADGVENTVGSSEPSPTPSIDQYMNLMEVVRPFFHAHGITQGFSQPRSDEQSNERPSSDFATELSGGDQKHSTDERKDEGPVADWHISQSGIASSTSAPYKNRDLHESDSSSMVVLAREKRKHSKKTADDPTNDGSNNSTNDGSNKSSFSDKRVQIMQPQNAEADNEDVPLNEDESNGNDGEAEQAEAQVDVADRQESTSASSSEDRNNQNAAQAAQRRYPVPAVVSEYSSSARTAFSGASNNNLTSTSGSGGGTGTSGTGSGTGSASNQGGSSGSGNDQLLSSNGNGSSGSSNDVKGSSEETMDNSGENNSGENSGGNSDATNADDGKQKNVASAVKDAPLISSGHRHATNTSEITCKEPQVPSQPHQLHDDKDQNAAREKKLQDKKRKRMNMRREYEEKVQQEMESSEGSRDRGEFLIRPGRPITLDKVLSFTKVARIVVKAGPPFLVVFTNAAYCRLSGIDSHRAVGKPISSLLSIPDREITAEAGAIQESPPMESSTVAVVKFGEESPQGRIFPQPSNPTPEERLGNQNHVAAEAAGRARAAASGEDDVDMCLERLVAASGFGKWHVINILAKPHHMLGRNVTVMKASTAQQLKKGGGGSNGSSISSNRDNNYHPIPCNMGISPVVSSPEAFNVTVVTDKDQDNHHAKAKRRKHHHHSDSPQLASNTHHQHRRISMRELSMNRKRHLITHYVIQLDPLEGTLGKLLGLDSHSSTSTTVEAQILGLPKSELGSQRVRPTTQMPSPAGVVDRANGEDEDEELESESSGVKEPVAAIG